MAKARIIPTSSATPHDDDEHGYYPRMAKSIIVVDGRVRDVALAVRFSPVQKDGTATFGILTYWSSVEAERKRIYGQVSHDPDFLWHGGEFNVYYIDSAEEMSIGDPSHQPSGIHLEEGPYLNLGGEPAKKPVDPDAEPWEIVESYTTYEAPDDPIE